MRQFSAPTWLRETSLYLLGILCTVVLLFPMLRLHRMDLNYPIAHGVGSDGTYYAMQLKMVLETGSWYENGDLSAPFGIAMYDFPHFDALFLLAMRVLGSPGLSWVTVLNLYYLATFPLTFVTTFFLFRSLGWTALLSMPLALLFAYQPYHLVRGQSHLMLASYFLLPLQILLCIWIREARRASVEEPIRSWSRGQWIVAILITFLSAFAGHYYFTFAWMAIALISLHSSVLERSVRPLVRPLVLMVVLGIGCLINLTPNLIYWAEHGNNREISQKSPVGSEVYGLKLSAMFLPTREHPVAAFRQIRERYDQLTPACPEPLCSIGLLASVGLLIGLGFVLLHPDRRSLVVDLGILSVVFILVSINSGFGAVFAYCVEPQLHALCRTTIVLALFGLMVIGHLLNAWMTKHQSSLGAQSLVCILMTLALIDIWPSRPIYDPQAMNQQYRTHREFAVAIQDQMPPKSLIHQMPAVSLPFNSYVRAIPYLFTDNLRWTNPAMLHSRGMAWCETLENLPLERMFEEMARAEVDGILLDTRFRPGLGNFRDPPPEVVWERTEQLHCFLLARGLKPIVSESHQAFFDLREFLQPYRERVLQSTKGSAPAIQPVHLRIAPDWAYVRPATTEGWSRNRQALSGTGTMEWLNNTTQSQAVEFRFALKQEAGSASQCRVLSSLLPEGGTVVGVGNQCVRLNLPPGRHKVVLQAVSGGKRVRQRFILDQIDLQPVESADSMVGR